MTILILANSKFKGGTSGGDEIYANFKKFWPCNFIESNCNIEYSPFFLCYLQRIIVSICRALADTRDFDIVYSSSDFLPDSIPGFIYKLKGKKWVAGFFLKAFKSNPVHYYTQKVVRRIINGFADFVIVTNPTMYDIFHGKKKTWINGGIDLSLAGLSDKPKIYDYVFCGRIHPSKGIDELLEAWKFVISQKPFARLAIIGDGDLGINYILFHKNYTKGIELLGYMGEERYEIYKQSRCVIYPTPLRYDHFSMAPIEAMACGCALATANIPTVKWFVDNMNLPVCIDNIFYNTSFEESNKDCLIWAQQFDYKKQVTRVWEEMNESINNGSAGDGGKFFVQHSEIPRTNYA